MKNFTDTSLHVYFAGNLRIYGCDRRCSRWYFTFNGAECTSPGPIDGAFYMYTGKNWNLSWNRLFDALNFSSSPHKNCDATSGKTNLGIHKVSAIMKVTTTVFLQSSLCPYFFVCLVLKLSNFFSFYNFYNSKASINSHFKWLYVRMTSPLSVVAPFFKLSAAKLSRCLVTQFQSKKTLEVIYFCNICFQNQSHWRYLQ